jgi:hypothetical protein
MAPVKIPPSALAHPMSPAFSAQTEKVEDRYDRSFLRRLFSFASSRGVDPFDVDDNLVAGFAEAVLASGLDRPKQEVRNAVRTWIAWPRRSRVGRKVSFP